MKLQDAPRTTVQLSDWSATDLSFPATGAPGRGGGGRGHPLQSRLQLLRLAAPQGLPSCAMDLKGPMQTKITKPLTKSSKTSHRQGSGSMSSAGLPHSLGKDLLARLLQGPSTCVYLCVHACVPVCEPTKVFKQLRFKGANPLGEACQPIVSISLLPTLCPVS